MFSSITQAALAQAKRIKNISINKGIPDNNYLNTFIQYRLMIRNA